MKHLWLAVLFSLSANAVEPECAQFLTPETSEVLRQMDADDFRVTLLTSPDQTKMVVLVGEAHRKTPHSAELGRKLRGRFEYFAYEESRTLSLGDKLNKQIWKPLFGRVGQRIKKATPFSERTEGSTINELLDHEWPPEEEAKLNETLDSYWQEIAAVPDSDLTEAEKTVRIEQLSGLISQTTEIVKTELAEQVKARQIWLEENHAPTLKEHLWSIPITRNLAIYLSLESLMAVTNVSLPVSAISTAGVVIASNFLPKILSRVAQLQAHPLFPKLFPIFTGRETSSDPTMVENILKAMARPEIQTLLAMFGDDHTPGIRRQLITNGYRQVSLR